MSLKYKIKSLLESDKKYRNDDRLIFLEIWGEEEPVFRNQEVIDAFMKVTLPEDIRRTRQKVVEEHPNLQADEHVLRVRRKKQKTKGGFVNNSKHYSLEFLENALTCLRMKWKSVPKEEWTGEEWDRDLEKAKQYKEMIKDYTNEFAEKLFNN